jgi:hypothetical protein
VLKVDAIMSMDAEVTAPAWRGRRRKAMRVIALVIGVALGWWAGATLTATGGGRPAPSQEPTTQRGVDAL